MDIRRLQSGYWVICDNTMLRCYASLEEAQAHVAAQIADGIKGNWSVARIKFVIDNCQLFSDEKDL